jgi:hypothetical protein
MPKAVVGVEASCTARWFEQLMNDLGHELRVGNPSQIRARARSRHKSDKRDADLLLDLLLKDEFPALWRRSMQGQSVLEQRAFSPRFGQAPNTGLQSPAGFGSCRRTPETRHSKQTRQTIFNGSQFYRDAKLRTRSIIRAAR